MPKETDLRIAQTVVDRMENVLERPILDYGPEQDTVEVEEPSESSQVKSSHD